MTDESIFAAALDIADRGERAAYLDRACAGQPELRRQVEELLAAHDRPGNFLDRPPLEAVLTTDFVAAHRNAPAEAPGTRIGPYKLLQQIGEGGMGAVWMAEQTEPVRRLVALKIIKPGLDSARVVARFEAERQALAMMDHPNVARVLEAGTTPGGRPFFVMELVKGVPITQFCDEHQLSPRERLALFVPVCQAVQHAHTKGVIHRDLKPSNVMVALYDDRPVPKVIDFGVAKATGGRLTERTLYTEFGAIVGTLEYMSPEQAKLNALDVDTRSDVYSLGVLLYELLTGTTPLQKSRLGQAGLEELLRLIREEEPPPPSTRLSQSGEALAAISAQRRSEPQALGRLLRGELDWIVLKALEKDRTRRYETANHLARDVEHYLKDEAVEACPPSVGYRLRKFARKHRKGLLAVAAFGLLLLAATAVSTWQAVRADRKAAEAEANARETARVNAELEATLVRGLLRPLGMQARGLSIPEIEALWELAGIRPEHLKVRFVTDALKDPLTTRQLQDQAAPALLAAVGLDDGRRAEVERLLAERLEDALLPEDQRTDLALVAAALGDLSPRTATLAADNLTRALAAMTDRLAKLPRAVIDPVTAMPYPHSLAELEVGLRTVASRLESKDAARLAETLIDKMAGTHNPFVLQVLADGLVALTARLRVPDAIRVGDALVNKLTPPMDWRTLEHLGRGLSAAALRLGPQDAARLANALVNQMAPATDFSTLAQVGKILGALVERLEPQDAARVCSPVVDALVKAIPNTINPSTLEELLQGLAAVAWRLSPRDMARVSSAAADALIRMAAKTDSPKTGGHLLQALSAVAEHLGTHDAVRVSAAAADALINAINNGEEGALGWPSLGVPVAWLEAKDAIRLADALVAKLARTNRPSTLVPLGEILGALAVRLAPQDAARCCSAAADVLVKAISATDHPYDLEKLLRSLVGVTSRLEARDAARVYSRATDAFLKMATTKGGARAEAGGLPGLDVLIARLEAEDVTRLADALIGKLPEERSPLALAQLGESLDVLAARLGPRDTARFCSPVVDAFVKALPETTDPYVLSGLLRGLGAATSGLEPRDVARVCSRATDALLKTMPVTIGFRELYRLLQGVRALAAHVGPADALRLADALLSKMATRNESDAPLDVAGDLLAVLTGVGPHRMTCGSMALVGAGHPLTIALLVQVQTPTSGRLSSQQLVDLLKHPLCFGSARQVVLSQLEIRFGRAFPDHWDFVRFAREQRLGLDLTSPPLRSPATSLPRPNHRKWIPGNDW